MSLMLGSAQAQLTLDVSQFTGAAGQAMSSMSKLESAGGNVFNKAGKGVDAFSGRIKNLSSEINTVGIAFVGLGVTITAAIGGAIKTSIDFNSAMANVNSIAQLTTKEIAAISDEVLKMASATGQGPQTLAEGLYDIYSSGFQGAEGLKILEVAAFAANAGLTTTAVSAKAVTAVLNAYGLEAEDAAHVSDVLFQTVNDGVLSFEQLATNLGNTLPLGNALGVSIEELAAAYAQMTLNGISATQAETQISALMRAAINPTEGLTAAIQAYGYESASALIAAEGLPGFLTFLGEASGGSSEKLFDLLGTSEAVNASLVLGKNDVADYTDELMRMTGASEGVGATQKALAKQMESTGFQLKRLKANFQVMLITIGTFFEPAIRTAANAIEKLIQTFLGLPSGVQKAIAILTAITGVVALVGGAMLLALPQILQFRTAMTALGGLKGIVSLIGGGLGFGALIPIILGATAVIGGLTLAYAGNYFGFRDFVDKILGYGKPVLDFFGDLKDGWNDLKGVFGGGEVVDDKTSPLEAMIGGLGGKTAKSGGVASTTTQVTKFSRAIGAVDFALGRLANNKDAPKFLRDFATSAQSALPHIKNFGNFLGEVFTGSPRNAMQYLEKLPASMQEIAIATAPAVQGIGELVRAFQQNGFEGFAKQLPDTLNAIGQSLFDLTINIGVPKIISAVGDIWQWVKEQITGREGDQTITLGDVVVSIAGYIKGWAVSAWQWFKGLFDGGGGGVGQEGATGREPINLGSIVVNIAGYVMGAIENVWSWFQGLFGTSDVTNPANVLVGGGGTTAGSVNLGNILVNILGFVKGTIADLAGWVKNDAFPSTVQFVKDIPSITVNVAGFVTGKIADLWGWLNSIAIGGGGAQQFDETGGTGMSSGITLKSVGVSVLDWVKGIWADVSTFVQDQIDLDWTAAGATPFALGTVNVKASKFEVEIDLAALNQSLGSGIDTADLSGVEAKGEEHGQNIMDAFLFGISKALSGDFSGIGIGGGGGGTGSRSSLNEAIKRYTKGLVQGIDTSMDVNLAPKLNELAANMLLDFQGFSDTIQLKIQSWADGIIDFFTFEWPEINMPELTVPLPNIDFPTISDLTDMVPGYLKDFWADPMGTLKNLVTGGGDPSFGPKSGGGGMAGEDGFANPGAGPLDKQSPAYQQGKVTEGGANMGGMKVTSLPKTGAGPAATKVPPLDTSAFDASVTAFSAKLQGILTAVNAVFVTAIPANITAGMTTSSAAITTNSTIWGTTFGTGLQSILTLVNAIFAVAIPANINLGMATSTIAVSTNMALMGASFAVGAQSILTVTNAVFAVAIPANVQAGMTASALATATGMRSMNASISSGMSSATGTIRSGAGSWPGIIAGISLYGAGVSIMHSLGAGIIAGFASVRNTLLAITAEIPTLKGPPEKDARLLYDNGVLIMEGLESGMVDRFGGVKDTLRDMSDDIDDIFSASSHGSRVQVPGGGASGGGSGGGSTSPGTTTTEEKKWSDAIAKGLQVTMSNALKNSGLGTDMTVGSLFNEADFMARRKEMGDALANNIADLFIGRTWVNSTDALINDGKFLEHYGSPVGPDESITNNPPIIDPTNPPKPGGGVSVRVGTPLTNRPNNGSSRVQQPNVTNHYTTTTTDARTTQQLASPELLRVLDGATKGRTSYSALSSTNTNRTLASGSRVNLGRV